MVAGSTRKALPKVVFEKLGIKPATPGLQGIFLFIPFTFFLWLFWVLTRSTGFVYDLCVGFMQKTPKGSLKVVLWRNW